MFLPEVAKTGAGMEIPAMFHQAAEDAVAAGLPVLLGMADMWYQNAPWEASEWAAMRARAEYFAARTDPGQVVLAALNEPAFDNAANWLPLRDRLLGAMRRAAPRHLLMWGGWEWCSARSLLDCPPPADPGTVAEVHDYEGGDAAAVTAASARWPPGATATGCRCWSPNWAAPRAMKPTVPPGPPTWPAGLAGAARPGPAGDSVVLQPWRLVAHPGRN